MNILTVDIGNSKTKLDIWNDHKHIWHEETCCLDKKLIKDIIDIHEIKGISFCSVGLDVNELFSYARETVNGEAVSFNDCDSSWKENSLYKGQIGADRMAAFLGVLSICPHNPVMIVDAGTAITIDIVNEAGIFCGGNISLGIQGRLNALHEITARLPLVKIDEKTVDFGTDTVSALKSGALLGAVAEILYDLKKASQKYYVNTVVITGGDAKILIPYLQKEGVNLIHDPYLVSRGLYMNFRKRVCCSIL